MSKPFLPPEILDNMADLLHDEPETLRECCLVSTSWIPRTRKYLFAKICFAARADLETWEKTFPDPSTSPGWYTRTLVVGCPHVIRAAGVGGWVGGFSRVVSLVLSGHGASANEVGVPSTDSNLPLNLTTCALLSPRPLRFSISFYRFLSSMT